MRLFRNFLISLLVGAMPSFASAKDVTSDERWSGKVTVEGLVRIAPDATLTIAPGTAVLFSRDAALAVDGELKAEGTQEQPISFAPSEKGSKWQGIAVSSAGRGARLVNVRVQGADQSVTVDGVKLVVYDSHFSDGDKGVVTGAHADIDLQRLAIREMRVGGIEINVGALGSVRECRIERTAEYGIVTGKKVAVEFKGNSISRAKVGLVFNGSVQGAEGNSFSNCEVGMSVSQAGYATRIVGNRFEECGKGIECRQFASPEIADNTFTGCGVGVECFQASSPYLHQNRFVKNKRALACIQMCYPPVHKNDFLDNDVAAYLHLSSYAVFHENNFERNRLAVELDNMSFDWEQRAQMKPPRQQQARNDALVKLGRAMPEKFKDEVKSEGFVDATENYWGEKVTAEMEEKGADADISAIRDWFDVHTLTYEGWPGEYKVDRVRYAGWKKARIQDAGPGRSY